MRICYDLDNTLCSGYPYSASKPYPGAAEHLKRMKELGHTIIIQTARGMGRTKGNKYLAYQLFGELTYCQLAEWGFEYDELHLGKLHADLYVDDKGLRVVEYSETYKEVEDFALKG